MFAILRLSTMHTKTLTIYQTEFKNRTRMRCMLLSEVVKLQILGGVISKFENFEEGEYRKYILCQTHIFRIGGNPSQTLRGVLIRTSSRKTRFSGSLIMYFKRGSYPHVWGVVFSDNAFYIGERKTQHQSRNNNKPELWLCLVLPLCKNRNLKKFRSFRD